MSNVNRLFHSFISRWCHSKSSRQVGDCCIHFSSLSSCEGHTTRSRWFCYARSWVREAVALGLQHRKWCRECLKRVNSISRHQSNYWRPNEHKLDLIQEWIEDSGNRCLLVYRQRNCVCQWESLRFIGPPLKKWRILEMVLIMVIGVKQSIHDHR